MATPITAPVFTAATSRDEMFALLQGGKITPEQYTKWDDDRVEAIKAGAEKSTGGNFIPKDAAKIAGGKAGVKTGEAGWVCIYGFGRRPISVPPDAARLLFSASVAVEMLAEIDKLGKAGKLSTGKDDTAQRKAAALAVKAAAELAAKQRLDAAAAQVRQMQNAA